VAWVEPENPIGVSSFWAFQADCQKAGILLSCRCLDAGLENVAREGSDNFPGCTATEKRFDIEKE